MKLSELAAILSNYEAIYGDPPVLIGVYSSAGEGYEVANLERDQIQLVKHSDNTYKLIALPELPNHP